MDITGAIFDCDGTLLDSMPMWSATNDWIATSHGATPLPLERVEALSLRDTCALYHAELGIGASPDALYEELCAHVRDAYAHEVAPFAGARTFLETLRQAGIPLIIASSTPVRELRCGLQAHGFLDYFQDVVSTEDVGGRDKEFPDVYLEAARRLGTDPATTWVFEDAPFGVRTARTAGFPVVGLMNDHDGRREEDVRPWCDLYVHGYAELSLALIADYARPLAVPSLVGDKPRELRALVIAGSPEPSSPALVARLAAASDYVICADAGANACRAGGVTPDVFCGDSDSASSDAAAWARASATTVIAFPSEKYATDLALALDCALHEAARRNAGLSLTVTCASGGRPDHALGVLGQLYHAAADHAVRARELEDTFELRILSPGSNQSWQLAASALGHTLSVVALEPNTVVSERGTHWELAEAALQPLSDLGVSNRVDTTSAQVTCHQGALAVYLLH